MTEQSTCKTCRYCDPAKEIAPGAFSLPLCRRSSPRSNAYGQKDMGWPTVNEDDWCGDYHTSYEKMERDRAEMLGTAA